ncbi:sodium:calcium antiporter [Marinicauda salina]|uniref:Sodium:calcium antiporter n=1 Tax=Marinicauda salina TaxID=2135793 RepID=A0A2U2BX46_9PROT|nr:calcium/sodium antiporter [Marinicauda salina]PWE18582.1 sodium:calcium antiporter [Marinicauda salina]
MDYVFVIAGLVVLLVGGEALVRGAVGVAGRLGVSPLLIGLVVVGFGTSAPELTTSVSASLAGSPGVAVGNVVGSNIANVLLILGAAALMSPVVVEPRAFRRDGPALAAAMLIAAGALAFAPMVRLTGAILVGLLLAYILASYLIDRAMRDAAAKLHEAEAESVTPPDGAASALFLGLGIAGVVGGAWLLVTGAVAIAGALGVPETVIGLSIVAVGTSLPELAASLVAARRGHGDLAFGNIVGSNIFNGLGILGSAALVAPFETPPRVLGPDLWVMLGASGLLIAFALTGQRVSRMEGGVLLALYAGYIASLAWTPAG